MIAYVVYTLGLYISDFVWEITIHLISTVSVVLDFLKKLFDFNRLIVINFWQLFD